MSKILLVVPPRPRDQILNLLPPYNLGYLATACRRAGHAPAILDSNLEGLDAEGVARKVDREKPDAVGITMFTSDYRMVSRLCGCLKKLAQPPKLILGGIHPSSFPEPLLQELQDADYLFMGEAEIGLPKLLSLLDQGAGPEALKEVPGLGWRGQGRPVLNPRAPLQELGEAGIPAWDLMNPLRYQQYPPILFVRQRPFAPIITTRGCPFLCTFCGGYNVTGRRIRNRPLELVFEEIALLRERYGIRELHIEDDNFSWKRERVVAFCEGLIQRNWKFTWTMPNGVRLDTLDAELLALMKKAGCYFLILGVESGSNRILQHMRKKITREQVEEKVRLVHASGILCHAFFMLGYPEEREEDFQATLDLALRLPLMGAHFSSYRPLPGTESSRELISRGEIQAFNFASESGTFASVLYAPRGMTPGRVKAWQQKMLRGFYFRPRIAWIYLRELSRHPGLALNFLRKAWLYLKK